MKYSYCLGNTNITPLHNAGYPQCQQTKVMTELTDESWLLDNGLTAKRTFSCLVKPLEGDNVLTIESENQVYILSILTRLDVTVGNKCISSKISLPDEGSLQLVSNQLELHSKNKISLLSAGDIDVNAAIGKISINAKHFFQIIQQSLIQTCKQMIGRAEQIDLAASKLLKTNARHQIITADKEMRVDAERINMG